MKKYDKNQIDELFGKNPFFRKTKFPFLNDVKYLGGIQVFDDGNIKIPASGVYFEAHPRGLQVYVITGFGKIRTGFFYEDFKSFVIESQESIYSSKSKSVVGRALIGGLLLGPVGAIVGGISGVGDKQVKNENTPENILTITINDEGTERLLLFEVKNKKVKEANDFFNFHLSKNGNK